MTDSSTNDTDEFVDDSVAGDDKPALSPLKLSSNQYMDDDEADDVAPLPEQAAAPTD